MGWAKATLLEAEAFGFEHPEAAETWATAGGSNPAAADSAARGAGAKGEDGKSVPKAVDAATKFIKTYNSKQGLKGGEGTAGELVDAAGVEEAGQVVEMTFMAPK